MHEIFEYSKVSEAHHCALRDLIKARYFESAAMLYEVIDPFVAQEVIEEVFVENPDGQELLLNLAKATDNRGVQANIGQFLVDNTNATARDVYAIGEILSKDALNICLSEKASLLIQDELFEHSDEYEFEQQYLSISDKAQLEEVVVEEIQLAKAEGFITGKGPFYISTSISSFTGEYSAQFSNEGMMIDSAAIDVSPFFV